MKNNLSFNFDVHSKKKYMHYWIKDYLLTTYRVAQKLKFNFKGKTVVDIGLGRGRPLALYKALGVKKVIGFDLSKNETVYAHKQAKRLKINTKIIIDTMNNEKLKKITSNSCEVVAIMDLLFCLPDNVKDTVIIQAKRILKPKGIMIVVDMQRHTLMSLTSALSFKEWTFLSHKEFIKKMRPFKLLEDEQSNYFYFANILSDLLIGMFGPGVLPPLNKLCKKIGINGSTRTYIFTK